MSGLLGIPTQRRLKKIDKIDEIDLIGVVALITELTLVKVIEQINTIKTIEDILKVKTSSGINIVIDQLTQDAYTERRSTIKNDAGGNVNWMHDVSGDTRYGKFFSLGCRGFISELHFYVETTTACTITFYLSPHPNMGAIIKVSKAFPAGVSEEWQPIEVEKFWNCDSLFIWFESSEGDTEFRYRSGEPPDAWVSSDAGDTFSFLNVRFDIRVIMKAQTVGNVPISGTINAILLPSIAGEEESEAVPVPNELITEVLTIEGAGMLVEAKLNFLQCTTTPSATVFWLLLIYTDGQLACTVSNQDLAQSETATSGQSSKGEFYQTSSETRMRLRLSLGYRKKITLKAYQRTGASVNTLGTMILNRLT